jgi:signal transduction histidine kinase
LRVYLGLVGIAAVVLPIALRQPVDTPHASEWLTVTALLTASVLNVEVARHLAGGLARTDQPHKALSAWAFGCAMLLPTWWLLLVVPVTYGHARWRGIRLPLWKWVGSGLYLVLCGFAAATVRDQLMGHDANWSHGDGRHGFLTMILAAVVFLALEALLFAGSALLNVAEDEQWLRAMLTSTGFYANEAGVLLLGGLFAMVWAAGFWFTLFFVPLHVLIQQAVLLAPLRERAAIAVELAAKNAELEDLNDRLADTNAELGGAVRFKSDLLAMLGHEISNPLTSVLGYSQVAGDALAEGNAPAARSAVETVDRNAQKVAAVLADVVALVASERGRITATPEPLTVRGRLEAAIAELPAALRPDLDCPPHLRVLSQPGHLDQILANLLSNATKYGNGPSRVEACARGTDVEIAIIDHGPGVPAEFVDHLFERYRRDDATSAKVPGTGLGLFISRELARANAGDLTHHKGDAGGAQFVLTLPAASAAAPIDVSGA